MYMASPDTKPFESLLVQKINNNEHICEDWTVI